VLTPEANIGSDVSYNNKVDTLSDLDFLAAPKNNNGNGKVKDKRKKMRYYVEKVIGPDGGMLFAKSGKDKSKLKVQRGAMSHEKLLSMRVATDGESRIHFSFGPHGTTFDIPASLVLSWKLLPPDVGADSLILYYYNNGEWQEETRGRWDPSRKRVILRINHFSRYYLDRR
jgi:hypothetical protein